MRTMRKLSALALAAFIATSAQAQADNGWMCTDTRDNFVFYFNESDSKTTGHHEQFGRIVEVKTTEGQVLLISESQMELFYRCMKHPGKKW